MSELPYLTRTVQERAHNPAYDQDAECSCGHPYYRHFDTYEDMLPVGCKYCQCYTFEPNGTHESLPAEVIQDIIELVGRHAVTKYDPADNARRELIRKYVRGEK